MKFKDTNYIVVGGTTGLGHRAAVALNKAGANVFLIGRKEESLKSALEQLSKDCDGISGDATDPAIITKAIEKVSSRRGAITGLYHVAGGSGRKFGDGPLDQMSFAGWHKTLDLNLTSLMISNKAIIEYFLKLKLPGIILNMGSVLAFSPSPKYFTTHAYAAAKSAIIGFSKSIAAYYAKDNIRINVIAPGLFETPMAQRAITDANIQAFIRSKQPLDGGRPGDPEDTINAVLMFLSPDSKFITGQVLAVDGGWSISEGQYNQ
ncbi:MAG: SDR family NAD(P)-dependent oxidoreductase [Cyclobacteriaceae bacterium]